ncbi:MAG: MBL fold metallo-hydrolase [Acidobacteriota bacterium]
MRISKYIHSCLLVEKEGTRILFDPGRFTFAEGGVSPEDFRDLSAVVITHQHLDHVDDASLKRIVNHNPGVRVLTNSAVRARLAESGIDAEVFEEGSRRVASVELKAIPATHEKILNAAIPQNTAFVLDDTLLHPGDSFNASLDVCRGISVLALPVMAPWTTELQVAEFAVRLSPRQIIPIHDGYAKDFFLDSRYENFGKYFSSQGIEFVPLKKPGDSVEV